MNTNTAPKVAVIPAAGKGTRFLPSTKATPKEMHPLLNIPLIHHCLKELKEAEVEEVIIVSHIDKKTLENYFSDHSALKKLLQTDGKDDLVERLNEIEGLPRVTFAYQDEQLGLAHAIYSAKKEIAGRDFYVLLPDEIFIPDSKDQNPCVELKKSFLKTGVSTISLLEVDESMVSQYGVAKIENLEGSSCLKVLGLVEKPKLKDAPSNLILPGRYLMKADVLKQIENTPERNGEVQFTDSMMQLDSLNGVITKCTRFDGGSVLGFLKANIYAALKDPDLKPEIETFLKQL
jgi:UTP--glucose-1-phosphate uridylyltransferase